MAISKPENYVRNYRNWTYRECVSTILENCFRLHIGEKSFFPFGYISIWRTLKEIDWLLTELDYRAKSSYCSFSLHHLVFQTVFKFQKVQHQGINFSLKTATFLCKLLNLKRDLHQARPGQRSWKCCSKAFKSRMRIAVSVGAFIARGWIRVPRWWGTVVLFIHT